MVKLGIAVEPLVGIMWLENVGLRLDSPTSMPASLSLCACVVSTMQQQPLPALTARDSSHLACPDVMDFIS